MALLKLPWALGRADNTAELVRLANALDANEDCAADEDDEDEVEDGALAAA